GDAPLHASLSTIPPPPDIYALSLHDALPIFIQLEVREVEIVLVGPRGAGDGVAGRTQRLDIAARQHFVDRVAGVGFVEAGERPLDRKSTRLNSSHLGISYAVGCFKKEVDENG